MNKQEFEKLLSDSNIVPAGGKKPRYTVSDKEWELIELVYNWYPSLSNNADVAKPIVVYLYNSLGIVAFEDMADRAVMNQQFEQQIRVKQAELNNIKNQADGLKWLGHMKVKEGQLYERCDEG